MAYSTKKLGGVSNLGLHLGSILGAIWARFGDFFGFIFGMRFRSAQNGSAQGGVALSRWPVDLKLWSPAGSMPMFPNTPAQPPGGRCGGLRTLTRDRRTSLFLCAWVAQMLCLVFADLAGWVSFGILSESKGGRGRLMPRGV